ncbi:hypothetical protein B566_EDAN016703 [Ephemera danica]|nr:hypothetical protein B566_EDAN016703 [Ephemera danica]
MSEEENVEDFTEDSTDGPGILTSLGKLTKKCISNQSSSLDIDSAPYFNEIDSKEWHVYHGSALIVSIEKFDENQASTRDGTARDEQMIRKMLEAHGFSVKSLAKKELTYDQITKNLDEFGNETGKAAQEGRIQCVLVVVMTHGYAGGNLFSKDGKIFSVQDVWFPLVKRSELANIPKIFIFQACRGDFTDEGKVANHVTALRGNAGPSSREFDATDAQGSMSTAIEGPSSGSCDRKDAQGSTSPAGKKVITGIHLDVHHPNSPNVLLIYATVDG